MLMYRSSAAELRIARSPFRLSNCMLYISWHAPTLSLTFPVSSSKRFPVPSTIEDKPSKISPALSASIPYCCIICAANCSLVIVESNPFAISSRLIPNCDRLCPFCASDASTTLPRLCTESAVAASIALAAARSVCLKIVESVLFTSAALRPAICLLRSPNTSPSERIFPCASYADNPIFSNIAAASLFRGFCSDRIMFRRCVPPSAAFIPLSARIPNATFSSVVPPARSLAVPPTVRIASPSCATEVFETDAVLAILSAKDSRFVCVASMPSALIASVTISLASASSIAPAPASRNTVGSAVAASSAL